MLFEDLGQMGYHMAWDRQIAAHAEVLAGGTERVLFVEHPPVITLGRRPGVCANLLASADELQKLGVEVVESDRGGDVTFHGPGQIVAYPIIRLNAHRLSVGGYVHRLEDAVIDAIGRLGIAAAKDPAAPGVWVPQDGTLAKICALGVRVRRGVTMHGIALNVTTDLRYFNLIVPCGLVGRPVTSMARILGDHAPTLTHAKSVLQQAFCAAFS